MRAQRMKRKFTCILFMSAGTRVVDRAANRTRARMVWSERRDNLSDLEFTRRYRLNKKSFKKLCTLLRPKLTARRVGQNPVTVELKVSMTLRYLAGGSYLDIAGAPLVIRITGRIAARGGVYHKP